MPSGEDVLTSTGPWQAVECMSTASGLGWDVVVVVVVMVVVVVVPLVAVVVVVMVVRTFLMDTHRFCFSVEEHARPGPVVTGRLPAVPGRPLSVNRQPLAVAVHLAG